MYRMYRKKTVKLPPDLQLMEEAIVATDTPKNNQLHGLMHRKCN